MSLAKRWCDTIFILFGSGTRAVDIVQQGEIYCYLVVRAAPTIKFFDEGALNSMLLLDVSSETRVSQDFDTCLS